MFIHAIHSKVLENLNKRNVDIIQQQKTLTDISADTQQDQYIKIPFIMNNFKTVRNIIKKHNKKVFLVRALTVFNLLRNEKDKKLEMTKQWVYKIPIKTGTYNMKNTT